MTLTLEQRFFCRIIENEYGCHIWDGDIRDNGYGRFQGRAAHRVAWEIANKQPVPNGLFVLHRCNVRACVNPNHLYVGDQVDNMQDLKYKRRRMAEQETTQLKSFEQLRQDMK